MKNESCTFHPLWMNFVKQAMNFNHSHTAALSALRNGWKFSLYTIYDTIYIVHCMLYITSEHVKSFSRVFNCGGLKISYPSYRRQGAGVIANRVCESIQESVFDRKKMFCTHMIHISVKPFSFVGRCCYYHRNRLCQ